MEKCTVVVTYNLATQHIVVHMENANQFSTAVRSCIPENSIPNNCGPIYKKKTNEIISLERNIAQQQDVSDQVKQSLANRIEERLCRKTNVNILAGLLYKDMFIS